MAFAGRAASSLLKEKIDVKLNLTEVRVGKPKPRRRNV